MAASASVRKTCTGARLSTSPGWVPEIGIVLDCYGIVPHGRLCRRQQNLHSAGLSTSPSWENPFNHVFSPGLRIQN
jgi:hypothetical protein